MRTDHEVTGWSPLPGWEALSPQEQVIAWLVSQAMTNQQVARQVFLSPHTVNYHLRRIFRKLGISSRVQLAGITFAHAYARNAGDPMART